MSTLGADVPLEETIPPPTADPVVAPVATTPDVVSEPTATARPADDRTNRPTRPILPPVRSTPFEHLVAWIASSLSWLFQRLPDKPLQRLTAVAGVVLYLCWRRRRRLVRENLRHISRWLAEHDRANPAVRRAATNRVALERLVIGAFGHYLRYYLEVALAPSYDAKYLAQRLHVDTPEIVGEALRPAQRRDHGRIFVGLHLGGIELPGLYAVHNAGVPITAPMEAIPNEPLQRYLVRRRGTIGVRIIPVEGARHALMQALSRGEIAGLIADRDLTGSGHPVTLFGAPTRLPAGPGLLAISSGAPTYVAAARRTGFGEYALRGIRLETPPEGRLRERLGAFIDAEARAFEDLVADAPEQWWTIFFPIWPAGFGRAVASGELPA